jgi:uncharacterized protein YhbP (UPF0306 family)
MEKDLKTLIYEYLKTQRLMQVATYGEHPWIANIFYVHDEDLNLYFVSKKTEKHSIDIAKNPNVSVAIADSHQLLHLPLKGIQLYGTCESVNIINKLEWMFKIWNRLIAEEKEDKLSNPKEFLENGFANVYKIKPKKIQYYNTEIFNKPEKFRVLEM